MRFIRRTYNRKIKLSSLTTIFMSLNDSFSWFEWLFCLAKSAFCYNFVRSECSVQWTHFRFEKSSLLLSPRFCHKKKRKIALFYDSNAVCVCTRVFHFLWKVQNFIKPTTAINWKSQFPFGRLRFQTRKTFSTHFTETKDYFVHLCPITWLCLESKWLAHVAGVWESASIINPRFNT